MLNMSEYFYKGQPLSSYSLWELGLVEKSLKEALDKREAVKDHPKLTARKIKLPPPNVEFLKLKDAIEAEIKYRQELQAKQVNQNV